MPASAQLNNDAMGSYIEKKLETHFDLHPPGAKKFACVGNPSLFVSEMAMFRDVLGWAQTADGDACSAACLFITESDPAASEIDRALALAPKAEFVLLRLAPGIKSTPLYARFEECGFRILFERKQVTYLSRTSPKVERIFSAPLDDPEIRRALQRSWRRIRELPGQTKVELLSLPASLLLTPDRFDIAVKCNYARLWKQDRARDWREFAFYEQALRITGPGDEVIEHDGSGKKGIEQFKDVFHSLICEREPENVPAVPVDQLFSAYDGAHRIAAAAAVGRAIYAARLNHTVNGRPSADFFAGTSHGHPPCPPQILDEAAIEYCRVKEGLVLALVFPAVASEAFAIDCLSQVGQIVHRRDVLLSPAAGGSLLRQIYHGHEWASDYGESSGFANKVKSCFPFTGVVRAMLIDRCDLRKLRAIKNHIRAHYRIGNHSIHITDSDEELLRVARVVFNSNSIDLLRMDVGSSARFHQLLFCYRDWLDSNGLDQDAFCVDGSAILALLGLRECRDLDFLCHGDPRALPDLPVGIDCHNPEAHWYNHPIRDIVGDPRLHCWYMGLKFCAPRLVLEMKRCRNEPKDRIDVALLEPKVRKAHRLYQGPLLGRIGNVIVQAKIWKARGLESAKRPLRPLVRAFRVKKR